MKNLKELFKPTKYNEPKPDSPLATIVITMDIGSGDMKLAGNVLKDTRLCLSMLIEAGHTLLNTEVEETKPEPAIAVTH